MKTKVACIVNPLEDRLVVEPIEAEDTTPGGIVLPEAAKEASHTGKVVRVGPGRMKDDGNRVPMTVKVGDTVLYSKYAGEGFTHQDSDYRILREGEILGVLES